MSQKVRVCTHRFKGVPLVILLQLVESAEIEPPVPSPSVVGLAVAPYPPRTMTIQRGVDSVVAPTTEPIAYELGARRFPVRPSSSVLSTRALLVVGIVIPAGMASALVGDALLVPLTIRPLYSPAPDAAPLSLTTTKALGGALKT